MSQTLAYATFTLCSRRPRQPRTFAQNVVLGNFFLRIQALLGLAKFSHGLSRYRWRAVRGRGCWIPKAQRCTTVLPAVNHGCQYVLSRPVTFWWGPSRFSRSDQGLTRLSCSVKASTDETSTPGSFGARLCPRYKKKASQAGICWRKSMMSSFSSSEKLVTTLGGCPPPII